jgi:hypothetical protein
MSKLKNENDMREFVGISGEYDKWIKHFIFINLRNTSSRFIQHPQTNGKLLSNDKYIFITSGPTLLVLDEIIEECSGTYQISFQNVDFSNLKDIEVGVLPVTNTNNIHSQI